MTSSEAVPMGAAAPQQGVPAARVLVDGHIHPATLLLSVLDAIRGSLVLALFALVSQSPWIAGLVVLLFVLSMSYAVVRFITFRYRLTEDELITNEGILHRQERRIPINRVQDLGFEQSILRRVLGLVVVTVETASGENAEAKIDSLGRAQATTLREVLLAQRARMLGEQAAAKTAPAEYVLHRASAMELLLRGLTNNRLGVILATLFGVWELLREFGLAELLVGVTVDRLSGLGPIGLVLALFALLMLALVGGWLVSVATSFLLYYNFTLTQRGAVFQRRYGLLTTHVRALPQRKVQRVLVEQNWLRRMLEVAMVRADSAGAAGDQRQERSAGGPNTVVPLSQPRKIAPLLPLLLPGLDQERPAFVRAPRAVVLRCTIQGALNAIVFGALAWIFFGPWALLALVLIPLGWVEGVLLLGNLAFAVGNEHVVLRWGAIGRYQAFVPLRKVQGVTLSAGPIDRLLGLATLTVWVAGGSPSAMHDLPIGYARHTKEVIARSAAQRRFVW
jgi:putative membrane protein